MTMNVVSSLCTLVQTASDWPKLMLFSLYLKGNQPEKVELWEGGGMRGSGGDWKCGRQDKRNDLVVNIGLWLAGHKMKASLNSITQWQQLPQYVA